MKSFNTNINTLFSIMSSDPSLNPDHPLYGFEYIASDKKGDMYKKNGEFYYLTVACVDGKKEGKAEMKSMGKDKPVCILTYQNNKLNGQCACFDNNGHILECTLKDDVLDGPFSEYDKIGSVICQGEYKNGIRVKEEFPSSSKKAAGAALLGFGSPGIVGGSVAASVMGTVWTTGVGTGLFSAIWRLLQLLKRNQ